MKGQVADDAGWFRKHRGCSLRLRQADVSESPAAVTLVARLRVGFGRIPLTTIPRARRGEALAILEAGQVVWDDDALEFVRAFAPEALDTLASFHREFGKP